MFEYIWILLPIGLLIGWLAAKRDNIRKDRFLHDLNVRYLTSENRPRDLADTYEAMPLQSDVEALKYSLILGDAFRRKGEIDHAIHLHQYIIDQSESLEFTHAAYYSLAQDYLAGGFLDRAESALRILLESDKYFIIAQKKLAKIFEQQRDWLQAISFLERIVDRDARINAEIAHLYCELAEEGLLKNNRDMSTITLWLDRALESDQYSIRALMIRTRIYIAHYRYKDALNLLNMIEKTGSPLIVLIVPAIYRLYRLLDRDEEFAFWLDQLIEKDGSHFYLKIWKAHHLVIDQSVDHSIAYLKQLIKREPNLQATLLLNQLLVSQDKTLNEALYLNVLEEIIDRYAHFRCEKCGFATRVLQWQCASCSEWDTSAPVSDIIALKQRH